MHYAGPLVDLIVANLSEYIPFNMGQTGIEGDFASNHRSGTTADLEFTLVDALTREPVSVPALYFTVYDLDGSLGEDRWSSSRSSRRPL